MPVSPPPLLFLTLTLLALFPHTTFGTGYPTPRLTFTQIYCDGPIKAVNATGELKGYVADNGGFSKVGGRNRGLFIVGTVAEKGNELVILNYSLETTDLDDLQLCNMLDESPRRLSCHMVNLAKPSMLNIITSNALVVNNKPVPHLQDLGSGLETFSKGLLGHFYTKLVVDPHGEFFLTCDLKEEYLKKKSWG